MKNSAGGQRMESDLDGPRALRPEEYATTVRFINSVFRPKSPYAMEDEYPLVLGRDNIENMRVIVKDGDVISHTAIYYSTFRSGELVFNVGGISSVATHPDYRGRGLASRVMRDCSGVMRERGCHLSFLWTARHSFYMGLGYESSGSFCLLKPSPSILSNASQDCEIVPYAPERLPEIMEIHDRESVRTERTTKEYEGYFSLPGLKALLALRNGRVSAYAVMGKGPDLRGLVHDWGGEPQDLLCLVRDLSSLSEADVFVLAPVQEKNFTRLLTRMNAPKTFMKLVMLRIIDVDGLSSIVSEHVSNRLGKDFRIARDSGGVKLKIGREEIYVEPARMLASVLFGPEPPSSFLRGLSGDTFAALDKVLPIPLFIWGLDWV